MGYGDDGYGEEGKSKGDEVVGSGLVAALLSGRGDEAPRFRLPALVFLPCSAL